MPWHLPTGAHSWELGARPQLSHVAPRPRPSAFWRPRRTPCSQQTWEAAAQAGVNPAQKTVHGLPPSDTAALTPEPGTARPRGSWLLPASGLRFSVHLAGSPPSPSAGGPRAWLHPLLLFALCSPGAPACSEDLLILHLGRGGSHNFIPSFNLSFGSRLLHPTAYLITSLQCQKDNLPFPITLLSPHSGTETTLFKPFLPVGQAFVCLVHNYIHSLEQPRICRVA